jgi:hypothetical protein
MSEPPNLRDVSKCCGNCDYWDLLEVPDADIFCGKCMKYEYKLDHPAFLCDDWVNE